MKEKGRKEKKGGREEGKKKKMGEKEKGKKSHMWTVLKTFHILKSLPLLNYFLTLSLLFPLCKEAGTQQSFPDTHVCKLLDKLDQQRVLAKFR